MAAPQRFVLLDRDGTLNHEVHYLRHPDQLVLLPGVVDGLRHMQALGLGLVVVTNQSGIGRGYFSEDDLTAIHTRLQQMLATEGISLAGFYHCPHTPDDHCLCRKPLPGMVEAASADHGFDPAQAFMIGDKEIDITLGHAVGATCILVTTGYGASIDRAHCHPAYVAATLAEAAAFIAEQM